MNRKKFKQKPVSARSFDDSISQMWHLLAAHSRRITHHRRRHSSPSCGTSSCSSSHSHRNSRLDKTFMIVLLCLGAILFMHLLLYSVGALVECGNEASEEQKAEEASNEETENKAVQNHRMCRYLRIADQLLSLDKLLGCVGWKELFVRVADTMRSENVPPVPQALSGSLSRDHQVFVRTENGSFKVN